MSVRCAASFYVFTLISQDPSLQACLYHQPQSPRKWIATPCSTRELAPYSPSTASLSSRMSGSLRQLPNSRSSVSRNRSVCVSTAAAIAAEPSTALTRCVSNVNTSGAKSVLVIPRRRLLRRSKPRKRAWNSPSERECSPFGLVVGTNWSISPQDNASDVPAMCARNYSFLQRQLSAINASMYAVRSVRVNPPSSTNGLMVIRVMLSLTAKRRRWRSSWTSLEGHGESRGLGSDGSARSATASF